MKKVLESRAFVGLGGNLGKPLTAMTKALVALDSADDINVQSVSSPYRTPPWGKTDQPDFLNAVAEVHTNLSPRALLDRCLMAEKALKRIRSERWGPRLIDLDILWFAGRNVHEEGLEVPHPRMLERAFVLVPLAEIAPDLLLDGETAATWAGRIDRQGIIQVDAASDWWRAVSP